MKKLVIISDTHGSAKGVDSVRALIAENDYCIHLGDGAGDMRTLWREYPDKIYVVQGNCAFFSPYPTEGELEIEQVKIFYTHGHAYGVKSGLGRLALEAKRRGCEIALYGHTHRASIDEMDGVTLINPGSLKLPFGKGGSYCYLVVNGKKLTPVIVGESVL